MLKAAVLLIGILAAVILLELPKRQALYHLHHDIVQAFLQAQDATPGLFPTVFLGNTKLWELIVAVEFLLRDRILLLHAFVASYEKKHSLPSPLVGNLRH